MPRTQKTLTKPITTYITDAMNVEIQKMAAQRYCSVASVVRYLIQEGMLHERHNPTTGVDMLGGKTPVAGTQQHTQGAVADVIQS